MKLFRNTFAITTMAMAGQALALPQEAFWVEVPIFDDAGDASDLTGFRSFDLMIQMEAGDVVNAQDFGFAGPNDGISLGAGQTFFQHSSGGDSGVDPSLTGTFGDLTYDTRAQMGTLAFGEFIDIGTLGGPMVDWDPSGVVGVWSPNVFNVPPLTEAPVDANNQYWMARVTITSQGSFGTPTDALGEFLGGQVFLSGSGPNGEFGMFDAGSGVVDTTQFFIPNAFTIPAPGSAAALGLLAGAAMIRRRR